MTFTEAEFLRCCGSGKWARAMAESGRYSSGAALLERADEIFGTLEAADWLEAFQAHPRIGERSASGWEAQEQGGVSGADPTVMDTLAEWNARYFEKFGYIFIVCATGKSAGEMLAILQSRIANPPEEELRIAAAEQQKITRLRLEKLTSACGISTHVLDTAAGRPAAGISVNIEFKASEWRKAGHGVTDENGRIANLLSEGESLQAGQYRLTFQTGGAFFPEVTIQFKVDDATRHYHVPLLVSPYGYTAYRGS